MRALRSFTVRSRLPQALVPLQELAFNLRWSWDDRTRDLFRWVDPQIWELTFHDPVRLLAQVGGDRLHQLAGDPAFMGFLGEMHDDLRRYMHGSAAVIGLEVLPVLEPLPGLATVAAEYAVDLGIAFQLSNFIRDVGEDLRRGRLYLPVDELTAFGVEREQLATGVVDGRVRRLLAHQIARAREFYRNAWPGIRLLHPTSRDCIATAHRLYAGILDAVEAADYRVLDRRVAVPGRRRARLAAAGLLRAGRARSVSAAHPDGQATPTTPG